MSVSRSTLGTKTTDFIRKLRRKHGNGAVWKIDAGATRISFVVKRRPLSDIVADIGDRYIEFDASVPFSFNGNSVIEISCVFSVNRNGRNPSQVNPISVFMGGGSRREVLRLFQRSGREPGREVIFMDDDLWINLRIVRISQNVGDSPFRSCPLCRVPGNFRHHDLIRPCPFRLSFRDEDFRKDAFVLRDDVRIIFRLS